MTFGFFYLLNSYIPSNTVRIDTETLLQRCVETQTRSSGVLG